MSFDSTEPDGSGILNIDLEHDIAIACGKVTKEQEGDGDTCVIAGARHCDIDCSFPGVIDRFAGDDGVHDNDARHEWLAGEADETPESNEEGEQDIQGWTHVADYSLHGSTPHHARPKNYYLHARIRHDNKLEFGMFSTKCPAPGLCAQIPIAAPALQRVRHGDIAPPLRIATKEEAEALLLKGGKIAIGAAPKHLGILMNVGESTIAIIRKKNGVELGRSYRRETYYGHIWSYWGTILNNVLYIVGIPVYTGNDTGSIIVRVNQKKEDGTSESVDKRFSVKLPPLKDNLKDGGCAAFSTAWGKVWPLDENDIVSLQPEPKRILEHYGDSEARVAVCELPLAVINRAEDGTLTVQQVRHGDHYSLCSLRGSQGGVYSNKGKLQICNTDEKEFTRLGSGIGGYQYGNSGYIETTSHAPNGLKIYHYQCFYAVAEGHLYDIRVVGPWGNNTYWPAEGDPGYGTFGELHYDDSITLDEDEEEEPEEDDPEDDPFYPPITPPDEPDEPDDPNETYPEGGFWLVDGAGVDVTAHKEIRGESFGYRYTIKVTQPIRETLSLEATGTFSVNDGNSFAVEHGGNATMWYFLSGAGGSIGVHNLTSISWGGNGWYANSHPKSITEFTQPIAGKVYISADFPTQYLGSWASIASCNQSNIVKLTRISGVKKARSYVTVKKPDGTTERKLVKLSFPRYKISLQEHNIRSILRNAAGQRVSAVSLSVSPGSITGTCSGSAGAPTVTCGGVTARAVGISSGGASSVTGSFTMYVKGFIDDLRATYTLNSNLGGWYEGTADNRHSASIGGSFTATAPARSF